MIGSRYSPSSMDELLGDSDDEETMVLSLEQILLDGGKSPLNFFHQLPLEVRRLVYRHLWEDERIPGVYNDGQPHFVYIVSHKELDMDRDAATDLLRGGLKPPRWWYTSKTMLMEAREELHAYRVVSLCLQNTPAPVQGADAEEEFVYDPQKSGIEESTEEAEEKVAANAKEDPFDEAKETTIDKAKQTVELLFNPSVTGLFPPLKLPNMLVYARPLVVANNVQATFVVRRVYDPNEIIPLSDLFTKIVGSNIKQLRVVAEVIQAGYDLPHELSLAPLRSLGAIKYKNLELFEVDIDEQIPGAHAIAIASFEAALNVEIAQIAASVSEMAVARTKTFKYVRH